MYELYINNVLKFHNCDSLNMKPSLARNRSYICLVWEAQDHVSYTYSELWKLHCCLSHLAAEKLYNLLRLACQKKVEQETEEILDLISKRSDDCWWISKAPLRFHVSLPFEDNLILEKELSINFKFLDGKAVLHVEDKATHFAAATYIDSAEEDFGHSVKGIQMAFSSHGLRCIPVIQTALGVIQNL